MPVPAGRGQCLAVLPAGSSQRWLYPSVRSWRRVLEAVRQRLPAATFVLVGKLARDERSSSSFGREELAVLRDAQPE